MVTCRGRRSAPSTGCRDLAGLAERDGEGVAAIAIDHDELPLADIAEGDGHGLVDSQARVEKHP